IGNRNRKGVAAIASALAAGLDDPVHVAVPTGRCLAYRFGQVDPVLCRPGEEIPEPEFRVAFELALGSRAVAALSRLSRKWSASSRLRLARILAVIAAPFARIGSSTSCLPADVWTDVHEHATASLLAPD